MAKCIYWMYCMGTFWHHGAEINKVGFMSWMSHLMFRLLGLPIDRRSSIYRDGPPFQSFLHHQLPWWNALNEERSCVEDRIAGAPIRPTLVLYWSSLLLTAVIHLLFHSVCLTCHSMRLPVCSLTFSDILSAAMLCSAEMENNSPY